MLEIVQVYLSIEVNECIYLIKFNVHEPTVCDMPTQHFKVKSYPIGTAEIFNRQVYLLGIPIQKIENFTKMIRFEHMNRKI